MTTIRAEIYQMPVISMQISYSVTITAPYYFPPRLYNISQVEVLQRYGHKEGQKYLYTKLKDMIWHDYHVLINDLPIMELMDIPYEVSHPTNFEFVFKNIPVEGTGFEPVASGVSSQRSTN